MSLASWKAEFYPVAASDVPASEAVDHSIRKWEGLRPENLARHGLVAEDGDVHESSDGVFCVSATSCALCQCYLCDQCPLAAVRGGVACGDPSASGDHPMEAWEYRNDPEPMLVQLRRAKEHEQGKVAP